MLQFWSHFCATFITSAGSCPYTDSVTSLRHFQQLQFRVIAKKKKEISNLKHQLLAGVIPSDGK